MSALVSEPPGCTSAVAAPAGAAGGSVAGASGVAGPLLGASSVMADAPAGGGRVACRVSMRRWRRGRSAVRVPGGAARDEFGLVALERLTRDRLGVARPVAGSRGEAGGGYGRVALQVQFDLPAVGCPGPGLRARHWSEVYGPRAAVFAGAPALRAWRLPARLRVSAWQPGDEVPWRGGGSCRPCGLVTDHCGLYGRSPRGLPSCADVREARLPLALRGHPFAAVSSRISATADLMAALSAARRTRVVLAPAGVDVAGDPPERRLGGLAGGPDEAAAASGPVVACGVEAFAPRLLLPVVHAAPRRAERAVAVAWPASWRLIRAACLRSVVRRRVQSSQRPS